MTRLPSALGLAVALAAAATAQQPTPLPTTPPPTADQKAIELFKAQKFDDALKELEAASKADPKLPPPRVRLASLFFQAGQGPAARTALERAAADDPRHPDVYLLNGSFAFGEGRLTDTILSCQTALQLAADPRWDPTQRKRLVREARTGLAAAFEARRDWPSAKEHLDAILADDAKNGPARQKLAAATFLMGKTDEAFAEFKRAHADDPASDLPELRMAELYKSQNDFAKAEEWFKKAVETHNQNPKAHRSYAAFLLDAGNLSAAKLYLGGAAKVDPTGRDTLALQALAARYEKDIPTAEGVLEKLYKDSPADTFAAWNLALVLAETGNADKLRRAVEIAESEVRKNQKNGEGYAVLGWCYYKVGRKDDAEKALVTATQAGALSRDAAYFLGRLLADKERWEDAVKLLKGATDARGGFVYKEDALKLLREVEPKAPKKEEPKK
jgi:tetratricopeptide (TPR) repeat protein